MLQNLLQVPKYTVNQMEKVTSCCRQLRMTHFTSSKVIIWMMTNILLMGTDDYQSCPERVKYKSQAKYDLKVLVWCAILEAEISEAFIGHVEAEAVTPDVYIQKCLPKLTKFIEYHHSGGMSSSGKSWHHAIIPKKHKNDCGQET